MKKRIAKIIRKRKNNIQKRISRDNQPQYEGPVINMPNIHYDLSEKDRGMAYGGMGAIQKMVNQLQLDQIINHIFRTY